MYLRSRLLHNALFLFVGIFPFVATAQRSVTLPDIVTLKDGTSVRADLRRDLAYRMARGIPVRRASNDAIGDRLDPREVTAVRYANGREYRSVQVKLTDEDGRPRPMWRFGELLTEGDITLIKVHLSAREYDSKAADSRPYLYVIRTNDMELVLRLTSIMIYERLHANPSRFRNLLKFLTIDCPRANELAARTTFTDGEILNVIVTLGDCRQMDDLNVITPKRVHGPLTIGHCPTLLYLDMRDADFSDEQLSGGIGYEGVATFNGFFRRVAVIAGAQYVHHSFRWRERSTISQSMVRANLSLGYAPLLLPDLRVTVVGGLTSYNSLSSSFNSFFSNNYFMLNGGLRLHHRDFMLGLHYEHLPGQIDRRPKDMVMISLGYRLPF